MIEVQRGRFENFKKGCDDMVKMRVNCDWVIWKHIKGDEAGWKNKH